MESLIFSVFLSTGAAATVLKAVAQKSFIDAQNLFSTSSVTPTAVANYLCNVTLSGGGDDGGTGTRDMTGMGWVPEKDRSKGHGRGKLGP